MKKEAINLLAVTGKFTKPIFAFLFFLIPQFIFCQVSFVQIKPQNILTSKIQQADSAIKAGEFGEVHGLLVIQHGNLVFENYYNGWNKDSLHSLQSVTKSVIATLLGCALQNNFISGTNKKIEKYYSQYLPNDSLKRKITIEHLLTQQHGLKSKEFPLDDPDNTWRKIYTSEGNWFQAILQLPMDTLPGIHFNYSNLTPVLTSGIIQIASGMAIDSFAIKFLFEPLQINKYSFWNANGGAKNNGMALLHLTSRDMAKIGQLYLQKGKWNNLQIISEKFVKEATSPKVHNVGENGVYSGYDYGYFWWSNPVWRNVTDKKPEKVFLARGAGGQNIIVYPEKKMVVVITAWNMQRSNKPQEIFDKYILNK